MKLLPGHMLRLVAPGERAKLGQRTRGETLACGVITAERQLQGQIANVLGLRGIVYCWHRTDKRSAATPGWPDFTFSVRTGDLTISCVWECKMAGKELEPHQAQLKEKMTSWPNGWRYRTIHSVDEALVELKRLGL